MPYRLFEIQKKVNLASMVGHNLDLQDTLRFSQGTETTKEEVHYEDSPDPQVMSYEILIPIDAPIEVQISPVQADSGTPDFDHFESVTVAEEEGIIIYPKSCHFVKEAGRFLVLKIRGGWKFSRNAATPEGECRYQDRCKARDTCPRGSSETTEGQSDRMNTEKQEVNDDPLNEDSPESPPLDEDGLPPDCVYCGGVASVVYCKTCGNWMCQECYDEHDC